jgi:hypothetical protein
MTLLHLDASFTMTPRASSLSRRNSQRVLGPKPEVSLPVVLRPKPPNPLEKLILYASTISTHVTVVNAQPPCPLANLRLTWSTTVLIWSTRSTPPHVHLFVDVPKCQQPTVSLLTILISRSKPHACPSSLRVTSQVFV